MPPARAAGNPDDRHVFGPRPLAALVPRITRTAFRRRSPASAALLADWTAMLGPALARVTAPRRLHGGTLTIAASGPIALELQHLSGQLIDRINASLGQRLVERLRFVQDVAAAAPKVPPRIRPGAAEAADRRVADLPPGPLRDALSALGRAVLERP